MILDVIFPKTCLVCNKLGSYVCISCAQKLERITKDICPYCERPSLFGKTHRSCMSQGCVDGLISVFKYEGIFSRVIKGIKYKGIRSAFGNLFNTFPSDRRRDIVNITSVYQGAVFIPIPLHYRRLKKRGFNQATIIARYFSQMCSVPYVEHHIKRSKFTPQQAKLSSNAERFINVRGAFSVVRDAQAYSTIFLIDDVWTTGATIKQAAYELKKSGCEIVYAFTLAR